MRYICRMKIRKFLLVLMAIWPACLFAQNGISVIDIMNKGRYGSTKEALVIHQDPAIDTLINRHILANTIKAGIDGYRIQIYRGGHRTAGDDANKIRARFMEDFPDIKTYLVFDKPNWFKVKVGDFRTREEAATVFFKIQARYPDAYLIRDVIGFQSSNN